MSWVRVWIHLVFSTKNREPFLDKGIRKQVFQHMKENANEKDIWIDCVNGYSDHAHCLVSLNRELSLSKTVQLIKGESSHWINQLQLTKSKFIWQDDYWAVSVSESHLKRVREYIFNQEEHHSKKTFQEEVDDFMKKYGWEHVAGKKI